jgi:hypothetical protein
MGATEAKTFPGPCARLNWPYWSGKWRFNGSAWRKTFLATPG